MEEIKTKRCLKKLITSFLTVYLSYSRIHIF